MVCSSKCIPPMIPWKTPITPQFKSQLLPSHCSSILKLRFCITFENLSINYLKPCQNKKGQSFVVMLGFCMSFFEFASAACCKKYMQKLSITTNVRVIDLKIPKNSFYSNKIEFKIDQDTYLHTIVKNYLTKWSVLQQILVIFNGFRANIWKKSTRLYLLITYALAIQDVLKILQEFLLKK